MYRIHENEAQAKAARLSRKIQKRPPAKANKKKTREQDREKSQPYRVPENVAQAKGARLSKEDPKGAP